MLVDGIHHKPCTRYWCLHCKVGNPVDGNRQCDTLGADADWEYLGRKGPPETRVRSTEDNDEQEGHGDARPAGAGVVLPGPFIRSHERGDDDEAGHVTETTADGERSPADLVNQHKGNAYTDDL